MAGSCLKNVIFVHKMDLDELNLTKIDMCMVFDPRNKYNEVIFKKSQNWPLSVGVKGQIWRNLHPKSIF